MLLIAEVVRSLLDRFGEVVRTCMHPGDFMVKLRLSSSLMLCFVGFLIDDFLKTLRFSPQFGTVLLDLVNILKQDLQTGVIIGHLVTLGD